jgi:two-component system, sensor histidine kinase and response regulator
MPGLSGIEAATRIRRLPGARGEIPIIALTAHVMQGMRDEVVAAGIDDHVTKPIDPDELARAIDRLTRKSRSSAPLPTNGAADNEIAALSLPDASVLARLEAQIGRKAVTELVEMLLTQTPRRLAELHRTLGAGDAATARQMAHDIASTAGNMGIMSAATLAHAFEQKYREGALDALPSIATQLDEAYYAAAAELKAQYG